MSANVTSGLPFVGNLFEVQEGTSSMDLYNLAKIYGKDINESIASCAFLLHFVIDNY